MSSSEQIPFPELFGLSIDKAPPNKKPVKVRVLLADDNTLIRQALRNVVENCVRLEVVGEARNGLDAIDAVRRFRPEVVVMDVNMPQLNGIDATECIKYEFPNTYIIGLSVEEGMTTVKQMQSAGYLFLLDERIGRGASLSRHCRRGHRQRVTMMRVVRHV